MQLRFLIITALLMVNSLFLSAQTIHGRVYIVGTSTAITNASVYYNASTIGTATNNTGDFILTEKADHIPIIASCVGYTTTVINDYDVKKFLNIYLTPKPQVLHTVVIGYDGMSRKEKEKIFLKEFLGTSSFGKGCTITNLKDVELTYHKKTKTLIANCDTPLQIDNKPLGYRISYFLQEFEFSPPNIRYLGNYIYKDNFLSSEQNVVSNNREKAYKGSRLQFIRALWAGKLEEKGFKIYTAEHNVKTHTIGYKPLIEDSVITLDNNRKFIGLKTKSLLIIYGHASTLLTQTTSSFISNTGYYGTGLQWDGGNMSDQRIGDTLPFEYRPNDPSDENPSKSKNADLSVDTVLTLPASAKIPELSTTASLNTTSGPATNNVPLFFEKTYLHTDRDVYGQGEDMWFKAYVVNAQDNALINYSHNLYVELIGPRAKIVKRETIRLEDGLGNGDFKLSDTIPAGNYRIRAYTNWMRNFGDNFIFEKQITILHAQAVPVAPDPKSSAKNKGKGKTATATPAPATANLPVVRFYPEGGSLVQGVSSIVAVKAGDGYGKGITAKGAVISSSGDTVSRFNCDSLGMGLFALLPVKGLSYHALVNLTDEVPKQGRHNGMAFELPAALSKGLTLQVRQTDSVIHAVINRADPLNGNKVNLVIKHGGKTQLSKPLQLQQLQTALKIPTASLPEGISAITLYDSEGKPECERLVYIHHPDNKNTVSIATNKKAYRPKEGVTVIIHTRPNTQLSMAVVDASAVPVQSENILSYLNLQSELKGRIENPRRYFDTTNVNRFKQLDQLLLTQGWRDFIWRRLEDTTLKLSYEPEQGIVITGRVRRVGVNKPLPGINITMHAPKADGQKLFWTTTDSAGRFGIYDTKFYGYQYLYLVARNYSLKTKGKSNSGGWLQVDSLVNDTLPIHSVKWFNVKDSLLVANPLLKLNISPDHRLKEVQIKGGNKYANAIPPEYRTLSMAEQKDYGNVLQYLLYTIPEAHAGGGACGIILLDNNGSKYQQAIGIGGSYADHSPMDRSACPSDFLQLPVSDVLKLTINRFYDGDFRLRLRVSLVLRPGSLKVKDFFDNTMADMVGYYRSREFYKPRIEDPGNIDLRTNTIHWEPNITTDATGKATVSFYNTAQTGKVRVIVQGITNSGIPLATSAEYEVK